MERQVINIINKQIVHIVLKKILSSYGKKRNQKEEMQLG